MVEGGGFGGLVDLVRRELLEWADPAGTLLLRVPLSSLAPSAPAVAQHGVLIRAAAARAQLVCACCV